MMMNEDLTIVHAYLCADGYVVKNPHTQPHKYYRVGLRNTNETLLRDFQVRFTKAFKAEPHLRIGQRCEIGSKEIYEILTKEFGSFYSWEWKMPKLKEPLLKVWLRAYFDCEGWVTCKSHQNRMVGADCVNEIGIKQVQSTLKILGIESKVKKRKTRNIFSLSIFGKENLIKFQKEIGFLHPEKKERLEKAIEDFMNYEWDIDNLENIFKTKAKIRKNSWIVRIISNKESNLLKLQNALHAIFNVESRINKSINGIGTIYYQLSINKKEEVGKLIKANLLNKSETEKWLKLQK